MTLFAMGGICATRNIVDRMNVSRSFKKFVKESLKKYSMCDWGNLSEYDIARNGYAVFHGARILAKYTWSATGESIYIITEAGHSAPIILFTEEYWL